MSNTTLSNTTLSSTSAPVAEQSYAIAHLFAQAVSQLQRQGVLPTDWQNNGQISRPKDPEHGDYASNLALSAAKVAKTNPKVLAEQLINALPQNSLIAKAKIAGPGFINVFLSSDAKFAVLDDITKQADKFGLSKAHAGKRIQVEFVSANPTSSLHVGHGRGAAFGMSVANLLQAVGYDVCREYYVNDAGRQMDILATSTYLRYLQLAGAEFTFPSNGYQGDYVNDIAKTLQTQHGDAYIHPISKLYHNVPTDAVYTTDDKGEKTLISGDKETHIDGLIVNAKTLLGDAGYQLFLDTALDSILTDIKQDLNEFGVHYEQWFSEKSVQADINDALAQLDAKGYLYQKDGNIWFKSSEFGDEKDRVVLRANGQPTYFASDIAYHKNKFDRGFDTVINVWGSDHHGYIARIKAALQALGIEPHRLEVILVQFVSLWRGEEKVAMSSRSGQFVTLRELREDVSNDAARFYYVARKPEVHMDFDLQLAKSQSRDNAVYYIQYAHARICRLFDKLAERGWQYDATMATTQQTRLDSDSESELLKLLTAYPDTIERAANNREPHLLTNYLKDLASAFHGWYNDNRILPTDEGETDWALVQARLRLAFAIKQVLSNGLTLLGLSAPQSM